MKYTRLFLLALIVCVAMPHVYSQKYKWTKYYMEVGALGGGSFYLGDVNTKLFNKTMATGGAFLKYKFNGRWEAKLQSTSGMAGIGDVGGKDVKTFFADAALSAEFNFFNFAVMSLEPGASNISPYIFAGLGVSYFNDNVAPIVPMGLGVKWRFAKRWNLGAYWSFQKTLWNDNFDLVDNSLNLPKSMWNNNDWYSTAALYISFDFWEICPSCRDGRPDYFYQGY